MTTRNTSEAGSRRRVSRERVLRTAIARADADGLEALTMRTLAEELGVAPMTLYRRVADKDDLVDAMVDIVFSEIGAPSGAGDWKSAMRRRAISIHDVLARHRWAIGLMESRRRPGPANLRHHDAVFGRLRAAGFSIEMAAQAYSVLDSYVYGFTLTKMSFPFDTTAEVAGAAQTMLPTLSANEYPDLVEYITEYAMKPGYDDRDQFEYGLDVILDGLEMAEQAQLGSSPPTTSHP